MMQYQRVRVISGKGSGVAQFAHVLYGIDVTRAGSIYAAGDTAVKTFDAQGRLQQQWPTETPGFCVAVSEGGDGDPTVFVGQAGQIEVFDKDGRSLAKWEDSERLGVVTAIGFFTDFVFVADVKDRCIRRYDRQGRWLNNIGKDNKTKGFRTPNGHLDFAVDRKGIIHACNPAKYRVERYSMEGELLGHFGRFGTHRPEDFPGCCNPTNVALTPEEHVVVTEKAHPRAKVFDAGGKMIALIGPEFFDPVCKNMDVDVDSQGRIYIIDTVRLSINVFAPVTAKAGSTEASKPEPAEGNTQP